MKTYEEKCAATDPATVNRAESVITLRSIDQHWMDHIDDMSHLREQVAFAGYAQRDPLIEYQDQGFRRFEQLLGNIQGTIVRTLLQANFADFAPRIIRGTGGRGDRRRRDERRRDRSGTDADGGFEGRRTADKESSGDAAVRSRTTDARSAKRNPCPQKLLTSACPPKRGREGGDAIPARAEVVVSIKNATEKILEVLNEPPVSLLWGSSWEEDWYE